MFNEDSCMQQQLLLTEDNKLVYKENPEYILIFVEGVLNSLDTSRGYIEYFLEGLGLDPVDCEICYVSNDYGYKHAIKTVEYWKKDCLTTNETMVLVTNMTAFLYSGLYNTWNDKYKRFSTYIVDNNGILHWIHDLTDRELREGHNLESIYRNGGFDLDDN